MAPPRKKDLETPKHLHKGFVPVAAPAAKKPADMTNEEMRAELAKFGLKAVPLSEFDATKQLTNRFDLFAADVKQSFEILAGQVLPLLNEIREVQSEHSKRINDYDRLVVTRERQVETITRRLDGHDGRHDHHDREITGVHKRLVIVEELITKKPAKRRRKAQRK